MKKTVLVALVLVLSVVTDEVKADFTFSEPVNLKSLIPVLNAAYDGLDCFSYDGLEMYIDSMRPGGYGERISGRSLTVRV